MAIQTITYDNKVALNTNPEIANINKVTDNDMNEIKAVVNNNATETSNNTTSITNLKTYSTSEVKTGEIWIDGKPIYRKVIYDTTSRNAGNYNIPHGINNLQNIIRLEVLCWQNSTTMFNATSTSSLNGSERATSYLNGSNISIRNFWGSIKTVIILEYTKN